MNRRSTSDFFLSFVSELVFWLALSMAFLKTAELMTYFAPDTFMGFRGLSGIIGVLSALSVEGMFAVMKYRIVRDDNPTSKIANVCIAVVLWAMSFAAQSLDTFVQKGRIDELPSEILFILNYGVPAIPVIVVGMMAVADAVFSGNKQSDNRHEQSRKSQNSVNQQPQGQTQKQGGQPNRGNQPKQNRPPVGQGQQSKNGKMTPAKMRDMIQQGAEDEEEDPNE